MTIVWLLVLNLYVPGGGTFKHSVPSIATEEACHKLASDAFGFETGFVRPFTWYVPEHKCIQYLATVR